MDWSALTASRISRSYYWLLFVASLYFGFAQALFAGLLPSDTARQVVDVGSLILFYGLGIWMAIGRMHDVNKRRRVLGCRLLQIHSIDDNGQGKCPHLSINGFVEPY
jgi:uncharacterized membrane protein YhaH (DUF805 family)